MGDSGAVDEIDYEPDGVSVPEALHDLVSEWIIKTLPGGWEIDVGSEGIAQVDVAARAAHFEHDNRTVTDESFSLGDSPEDDEE
jgi:hypothetical protein